MTAPAAAAAAAAAPPGGADAEAGEIAALDRILTRLAVSEDPQLEQV